MMADLESLESLVLGYSFSTQYYDFNQGGCYDEDEIYPHNESLSDIFDSLSKLKEVSSRFHDQ
jgi:hypothetical protein